ncbi:MAG: hypothetical protein GX138_06135 [Firmicutes bacterium]|nr:hypothetical protein [Bacillota bacterium]
MPFMYFPFPFNSHHFWAAVLFSSFILFYPIAYFSTKLLPFYVFLLVRIVFTPLIWADKFHAAMGALGGALDVQSVITSFFPLFIALLVYNYYVNINNLQGLRRICRRAWFFSFLGIVNMLVILIFYPRAMVDITLSSLLYEGSETVSQFKEIGFLGYGFLNALSSMFPVFIYFIMKIKLKQRQKIGWTIFAIVIWATITRGWTTAFLLFSTIFSIVAVLMKDNYVKDIKRLIIILIFAISIPSSFTAGIFYKASEYFPDSKIGARLYDAGLTIENPNLDYYASTTHAGKRLGRTPMLWKSFLSNPLTGGGMTSEHVAWLDMLSLYGLLGFLPWLYLVYKNFRFNIRFVPQSYSGYYMLCVIAFVAMGFLKNTGGAHVYIFWFLIAPGSAFIYRHNSEEPYVDSVDLIEDMITN